MRKPFVAGNWKMNKTAEQATLLVADLLPELQKIDSVECVLCPPFTSLMVVSQMLSNTNIGIGAQNMYSEANGAFTGEVSPEMVKEFCKYVIIGHSERRSKFGETDQSVYLKVRAALENDLIPIMCVGESDEENTAGKTAEVVERQVKNGLINVERTSIENIIIAYEPVWAIGTGRAASSADAQQVIGMIIRKTLATLFGEEVAQKVRILYGGSVTGQNAAEFFEMPDIDGGLIGGASLKPQYFINIVKAAIR